MTARNDDARRYADARNDDRLNAWDGVDDWPETCPDDELAAAAWYAARFPDDDEADALELWADAADASDVDNPTIY